MRPKNQSGDPRATGNPHKVVNSSPKDVSQPTKHQDNTMLTNSLDHTQPTLTTLERKLVGDTVNYLGKDWTVETDPAKFVSTAGYGDKARLTILEKDGEAYGEKKSKRESRIVPLADVNNTVATANQHGKPVILNLNTSLDPSMNESTKNVKDLTLRGFVVDFDEGLPSTLPKGCPMPSAVVYTSLNPDGSQRGHWYYFVSGIKSPNQWKYLQSRILETLELDGYDTKALGMGHGFRVPGSQHLKEGVTTDTCYVLTGVSYTALELSDTFKSGCVQGTKPSASELDVFVDVNGKTGQKSIAMKNIYPFLQTLFKDRLQFNVRSFEFEFLGKPIHDPAAWTLKQHSDLGIMPDQKHVVSYLVERQLAGDVEYDPVKEYFDSLPDMGLDEAEDVLEIMLSFMRLSGDTHPLYKRCFKVWLTQAINRIYQPGCPGRFVLVLLSEIEKIGKTTFFKILGSLDDSIQSEYTTEEKIPSDALDRAMLLAQNWIIIMDEIAATFKRTDSEDIKALITKTDDRYRVMYRQSMRSAKRRSVFGATSNHSEILSTYDKNTRYMTIDLNGLFIDGEKFDITGLIGLRRDIHRAMKAFHTDSLTRPELYDLSDLELKALIDHNKQYKLKTGVEDPVTLLLNAIRNQSHLYQPHREKCAAYRLDQLAEIVYGRVATEIQKPQKTALKQTLLNSGFSCSQCRVNGLKAEWFYPEDGKNWDKHTVTSGDVDQLKKAVTDYADLIGKLD